MRLLFTFLILSGIILFSNASSEQNPIVDQKDNTSCKEFKKGEYGFDLEFLRKYVQVVELKSDDARLVVIPEYQGRVMTSTSGGLKGYSYGWINYDLISSSLKQDNFNPYGGEERIWLGPEGGQFSIFFKRDTTFNLKNWYVPAALDKEPFTVLSTDNTSILLSKSLRLENFSGTIFNAEITRRITLLNRDKINEFLGLKPADPVRIVAFQSDNGLKNTGISSWTRESGALSVWMLSMLNPSSDATIVIPYKPGEKGRILYEYFGKIPSNRLKITQNAIFFLGDGRYRSKIGISPERAVSVMGSYDSKNRILTIVQFDLPANMNEYVNSALEIQKEPFHGDIINSYNDGPAEGGKQLGPFYELEISSPAAFLKPGQTIEHVQRIYHIEGSEELLNKLAKSILKVSLDEIRSSFNN